MQKLLHYVRVFLIEPSANAANTSPALILPTFERKLSKLNQDYFIIGTERHYYSSKIFRRKCYWLGLYLLFSLSLMIDNKFTLEHFPFPFAVTGVHAFFNVLGLSTLWYNGTYTPTKLHASEIWSIFLFSFLFSQSIVLSNLSLEYASLPLHQTFRSLNPLFVVAISIMYFKKNIGLHVYPPLILICTGVLFTTLSDYKFGAQGLLIALLAATVAGWKTVCTTAILKAPQSRLSPLDLMFYISPLTCLQMLVASVHTNESTKIAQMWASTSGRNVYELYTKLALNAVIAVGLNIASFTANKYTGAVAMSIAENAKQVLTVLFAALFFRFELNYINGLGLASALIGGAWYGHIEYQSKQHTSDYSSPPGTPICMEHEVDSD